MRARLLAPPLVLLAVWLAALASPALAGTFTLFDRTFTRDTGQPQTIALSTRAPSTRYTLRIQSDRVASAVITLNGAIIVSPDEFNNNVTLIEKPVTLQASNTLSVEVRGQPGGSLRLLIVGEDDEPPVIRATATPAANAAGWHNTDVRVTFTCDDAISGIASCPPPIAVSTEGTNQVVAAEAVDVAGNRASASVTLNIDKTPPNLAPSLVPPPNAAGWNRSDVTIAFTCVDALSQIAGCTPPQLVSREGAAQSVTGMAVDRAGNQATLVVSVSLDKTLPRISATVDPLPNVDGWHRAPPTVRFACEDSLSGVLTCPDPVTVTTEGQREVSGTVVDAAGNSSAAQVVVKLDVTGPTLTPVFSPPPNAAGWHNTDVTVSFRCEDGGSGVKTCAEPQTVTTEGVHALTPVVTDAAGNTFTGSVPVRIDKTPPTIAASPSVSPNQQGWHNTPVTVSFACGDALSELAGCSPPAALDRDGEHRVQGTAVDVAGNSAEAALVVRIDQVAPTIQSALTPQPNARGWNNSDVTISFTCDDAGSGIHSCAEPELVSQEGSARQVAGVAIDRAGNSARAEAVVNLDKTSPLITATPVPAANAAGWHSTPVTVTFTCSDALSTVETCPAPVSRTSDVVGDVVRGVAVDQAGNSAEAKITLNIDTTPPTLKPVSSAPGRWSNQDVQVSFDCADGGSGVASCSPLQVISGEGTHTVPGTVTDAAGNSDSASIEVNIDRTPPTIHVGISPQPGPGGFTNRDITVTFECTDDRSGIATCPPMQIISAEGAHTISGSAIDQAGNTAEASVSFTIDTTAPAIQAVPSPAPNANGWNNTAVTVAFVCADTGSQLATCPVPVEVVSEGRNQRVIGTAVDGAGNTAVIETTLNLDLTPPTIVATAAPPPNANGWNSTPVTVSFTCADALSEIDGCAQPQTVGPGANQAIVGQAVDRAGNVATAGVNVSVDLAPPVVTATIAPPPNQAGWNNADVTISFECADSDSGVAQCPPAEVISTEGASQPLTVTASDRAGNAASLTAAVSLDKTAPQVVIGAPADGATLQLSPVAVTGTITEQGSGLAGLTCNGVALPSAGSGFDCARPLVLGPNTVVIEAVDVAGNAGSARVDLTYAPNGAPTADAGGPYSGVTDAPIQFDGSASTDPDGDALTFQWSFGDGQAGTGEKPTHTYATAGTFTVTVTVSDGKGGVHEASVEVSIAAPPVGVGVIAGRVYNDADGLPIAGASVHLLTADGQPASLPPASTDVLGRFRLATAPGPARILITRDGYTRAERSVQVAEGKRVDPLDARLTPIDAKANLISSVTGGAAASGDGMLRLEVPAGAMSDDRAIRLTAVGPQGAAASVPLGWSPVLLADVSPREALFQPAASLTARTTAGAPADATVVIARWDETSGAWIAHAGASRSTDGKELQASVDRGGQYAFLLADLAPNSPPLPAPGQSIEGVSPRAPPGDVQVTITPSPRILFARPEARSRVGILAKSSAQMPSGTPLTIDITETFNLSGGRRLHRWPGSRTLALHTLSGAGLGASFNVKPSRSFPAFALRHGVIDLAGRLPVDPFAARGAVIGPAGGQASADTGERVTIPAGATSEPLPVLLARLSSADVPLTIPSGLSFLGAVFVDLHGGTLTRPAALSIPAPAGLASNATVLVVEIVEADELTRVALAAIGRLQGGSLVGVTDVLGDRTLQLPGVRREGRYVFLRSDVPLGFLTGLVTGLDGAPLAGAIVESDFPIAALTDADGRYVLAGPVGDVQLRATNLLTKDTTTADATIASANSVSTVSASLGPTPPFVTAVNPPNGAVNVARAGVVSITFSEPIDRSSLAPGSVTLSSGGAAIGGAVSLAPGNSAAVFRPGALLDSHTTYQLAVAATIRDLAGNPMAAPFASQFTTVDETPPPRPPAGAIAATIPDAAGNFVLSGTQGTADPGGVVLVKNLRTNALTTLTPSADGSFSGTIAAARADRLELTIQDAAGNKTMVAVPAFRAADGSVVVGQAGGRVEGAVGVFVEVPPGALPDGTVVKVEPVAENQLPLAAPADIPFAGGVRLDLGGVKPLRPLDIGVSAPADASPQDQILVARPIALRDGPVWTLVDRAQLDGNRYTTASPPFVGVIGQAVYGFFKPNDTCVSFVHLLVNFGDQLLVRAVNDPFAFLTDVQSIVMAKRCESPLHIQVLDPDTNALIQQIDAQSPPQPGAISTLPELLTDDDRPPSILDVKTFSGQQVALIEVRFSEPMDAESVNESFRVEDSTATEVAGVVELSLLNTVAVFRPQNPFRLGEQYLVTLEGAKDVAQNAMVGEVITFTPFDPSGTEPFPLKTFSGVPSLASPLQKCAGGACNFSARDTASIGNMLFVANGLANASERYTFFPPMRLLAVDVRDVTDPERTGFTGIPSNPRALAAIEAASFTRADGIQFSGDLLLVANGGRILDNIELAAKLEVYDVTPCTKDLEVENCLDDALKPRKGQRFLSTPTGEVPKPGVPVEAGVPQQIAVLHQRGATAGTDTIAAYVTVSGVGLEAVDVTKAYEVPEVTPKLGPDGFVRGDFLDVAVVKSRVVAVESKPTTNDFELALFSAQLTDKLSIFLPGPAARLTVLENVLVDIDKDGRVGSAEETDEDEETPITAIDELFDLAIVGSGPLSSGCAPGVNPCGSLYVVDLSVLSGLGHLVDRGVISQVPLPGPAFSVQVDSQSLLAYVEVRGKGLVIVDLSHVRKALQDAVATEMLEDANEDGRDDRILAVIEREDVFTGELKVDLDRGIVFLNGSVGGLSAIQVANRCNELALDFREKDAEPDPEIDRTGERDDDEKLIKEKELLFSILQEAAGRLIAGGITGFSMLEQGSGACFWREGFPRSCTSFEPGSSDHDIEVYVPQSSVKAAQAILDDFMGNEQEDKASGVHHIGPLSLFAFSRDAFEAAELLNGTPRNRSGDATGDLALGRQLLLLLWILEGEYIPGFEGMPLTDILTLFKAIPPGDGNTVIPGEPSGVPRLEGYEWSLLQEFNFYKSGVMLRLAGACKGDPHTFSVRSDEENDPNDPALNFEESHFLRTECGEQIHAVGKAAIRVVMARLAAADATNPEILTVDRDTYRKTECLTGVHDVRGPPTDPDSYTEKPCGGFEEYIASRAIKSVRDGLGVFQESDLPKIFTFYCAKVGKHCADRYGRKIGGPLFATDEEANNFIAGALEFIQEAKTLTVGVYEEVLIVDTKPIGTIPFLDEISDVCAEHGIKDIDEDSPRKLLRECNRAIVGRKVEGNPDVDVDPPGPIEIVPDKTRRKNLEKRFGARGLVLREFRVRALNLGIRTIPETEVRMYEGDGIHQEAYTQKKEHAVTDFEAGERRVLDLDDQGAPIFPVAFRMSAFQPNVERAIAFFLDPERRVPEGNKEDNQAAFFYYVLDPDDPAGPPNLPPKPVPAIPDVGADATCDTLPGFDLEVTARRGTDPVLLGAREFRMQVGQEVVLDYRVTNAGDTPLTDLIVRRSGSPDPVFGPVPLPPASTTPDGITQSQTFVPFGTGTFEIVASGSAKDAKGNTVKADSARVRITVVPAPCDEMVVPLEPDPNPIDQHGAQVSEVMQGGSLFRYYRLLNGATGQPIAGGQVNVQARRLPGGDPFNLSPITTNDEGFLIHQSTGPSDPPKGAKFEASALGLPDQRFELKLRPGFGLDDHCGVRFEAQLKERAFSSALRAGSSLELEGAIEVKLSGKAGSGFDLTLDSTVKKDGGTTTVTDTDLTVGRNLNAELGVGVKFATTKAKLKVGIQASLGTLDPQLGLTALLLLQDKHQLAPPLDLQEKVAVAQLLVGLVAVSAAAGIPNPSGPLLALALNELHEQLAGLDQYRTGVGGSVGLQVAGGVEAQGPALNLDLPEFQIGKLKLGKLGFNVGGDVAGEAAAVGAVDVHFPVDGPIQLEPSLEYRSAFNGSVAVDLGFNGVVPESEGPEFAGLTQAKDVLKNLFSVGGGFAGTVRFAVAIDSATLKPKSATISVSHQKQFGLKLTGNSLVDLGDGKTRTITFRVSDKDPVRLQKAIDQIVLLQFIGAVGVAAPAVIGPQAIGEQIFRLLRLADEYEQTVETGDGVEFPFGLDAFLEGVGLGGEFTIKGDSSETHATEKGTVRRAGIFKLEQYPEQDNLIPQSAFSKVINLIADIQGFVKSVVQSYKKLKKTVERGLEAAQTIIEETFASPGGEDPMSAAGEHVSGGPFDGERMGVLGTGEQTSSTSGVQLIINGAAEPDTGPPFVVDLISFQYKAAPGPLEPTPGDPAAVAGSPDRPHYGVGGFFHFSPANRVLAAPATLTISYLDSEVAGFPESSLAIYRWNDVAQDWDHTGGTVDAVNNAVVAEITTLGLYTVAPAMPAGETSFAAQAVGSGTPDQPTTTVTLTSAPLRLNDGRAVPDGTLYTVRCLVPAASVEVPLGTILAADVDPLTDGIQIASHGGLIQFDAELPGGSGQILVLAYSKEGTAMGDQVIAYQQP